MFGGAKAKQSVARRWHCEDELGEGKAENSEGTAVSNFAMAEISSAEALERR